MDLTNLQKQINTVDEYTINSHNNNNNNGLNEPDHSEELLLQQKYEIQFIDINKNMLFKTFHDQLTIEKNNIDRLENVNNWDKIKKLGNPYELIFTSYNKKRRNDSISLYNPISRSYFKLWEIFHNFDIFENFNDNQHQNMVFSHLAEGPGGFMEATFNYRQKILNQQTQPINTKNTQNENTKDENTKDENTKDENANENGNIEQNDEKNKEIKDKFYGITLKPTSEYIPDWNKLKNNFKDSMDIIYGNLYHIDEVNNYIKIFENNKAHFVSADGGFDYSANFNGQEINSCQIIYSECIIALNVLRKGGSFVCKVFDVFSYTMAQILNILYSSFDKLFLYKPNTSRPANSEKYIICMGFLDNISQFEKNLLLNIIAQWQELETTHQLENRSIIFKKMKIDNIFIKKLADYNQSYIKNQIYFLQYTINIAKNHLDKDEYKKILKKKIKIAIDWCTKYGVPINNNSGYLTYN